MNAKSGNLPNIALNCVTSSWQCPNFCEDLFNLRNYALTKIIIAKITSYFHYFLIVIVIFDKQLILFKIYFIYQCVTPIIKEADSSLFIPLVSLVLLCAYVD